MGNEREAERDAPGVMPSASEPATGTPISRSTSIIERLSAAALLPRLERRPAAEPPGTPSFARGLWRIAAADVSSGNRVVLLHDGMETFSAMLELIEAAEGSVNLEGYIFRDDEVGRQFADALMVAAARGVKVRLLVSPGTSPLTNTTRFASSG